MNEENVIVKGLPKKNVALIIATIIFSIILILSISFSIYLFENMYIRISGEHYDYNAFYDNYLEFFLEEFFCDSIGFAIIPSIIAIIVCFVLQVKTSGNQIAVTNEGIYGKLPGGKDVFIPLNQITGLRPCTFNGICISYIGNSSNFYCIANRDQVTQVIATLLTNRLPS